MYSTHGGHLLPKRCNQDYHDYNGPNFIELLKQTFILLNNFLLRQAGYQSQIVHVTWYFGGKP